MAMEITQVTKAFLWLETQDYTHAFDLNDFMSMIRKVQTDLLHRQLKPVQRLEILSATFMFVQATLAMTEQTVWMVWVPYQMAYQWMMLASLTNSGILEEVN